MFRIIMLLVGILTSCEHQEDKRVAEDMEIPVHAIEPTISSAFLNLELIGTLKAMTSVDILPQVGGHLLAVLVNEGEWVKAGTPLFKVDPEQYLLEMKEAEAQITIDKASLEAIQRKLTRLSRLNDKELIAESEWDKLHTEAAKIAGQLELDNARMEIISLKISHCTIIAPIDGRVGKIDASPGQVLLANQVTPLTTILQLSPLLVEFTLTEKEVEQVQGQSKQIQVTPLCKLENHCEGKITFIDNQFDVKTGQILVRGSIPNLEHNLRPGQLVQVQVPIEHKENVILIPQKAVKRNQEGPYVYIISADQTAEIRPIALGEEMGKDVIIKEGLGENDTIITEGHLRLHPGAKVKL